MLAPRWDLDRCLWQQTREPERLAPWPRGTAPGIGHPEVRNPIYISFNTWRTFGFGVHVGCVRGLGLG